MTAVLTIGRDATNDIIGPASDKPQVTLITPVEYAGGQSLSLIGNVRAFTEAKITSEKSGRVVSVNASLGQTVQAGQILGSLENASERAAVLQAEGAYEAALAAAAQTKFGVSEAETRLTNAKEIAISSLRSAYTTTNSVVVSNIDKFFAQPNSPLPGLRIGGRGYTMDLNNERVAYQDLLPAWQARVDSLTLESDLSSEFSYAKENVERTIAIVDIFLFIFDQRTDEDYAADEVTFTNMRSTLINILSSMEAARSGLASANDVLARAAATASGGDASAADAQVKQALGALRSVQANLEKTYFRTPISGTVNSIDIKTGDFVNSFSQVAVVANNKALEVVTYVSDNERSLIAVGSEVSIDGTYAGVVTNIAPAVDPSTGKTEVRIATEGADIKNGDTVRVTKETTNGELTLGKILVPLSAVKFEAENGSLFLVEDGKLVSRQLTLGVVRGGSVEVLEGLSSTEQFVEDARGLYEGTEVDIAQ